jgi:parallel beta helix pectate lyase-like protein
MSTEATSRRWVGQILAAGVATVIGIGIAPGTAMAATTGAARPAAAPVDPAPAAAPRVAPPRVAAPQVAQTATAALPEVPAQQVQPDTSSSARTSWEARGRPDRMAIVREYRIDLVSQGRVTSQIPHGGGPVTLAELDRSLPQSWLKITNGTAVLSATIVLVRNTTLEISGSGGSLHTLQLAGGASSTDAASIHTGGGRVVLTGLTIGSVDPATGQPVPATAAGRPMIVASSGGRLEGTDLTISDLGIPATATDSTGAAVEFRTGSTGSLVRTAVQRGSAGIALSRSNGVHLEDVTVSESTGDGLVLAGDRGTTLSGIRAVGNGENGVLVTGQSSDRPVNGITTSGNQAFGIVVVGQTGTRVNGISTSADTGGGLRVSRSSGVTVTDFTATDQRIGVFTHVSSSGIVLDGVHTSGGSRGIVIEKSSSDVHVLNSTFTGARVAGAALDGKGVALDGVQVQDSRSGIRVERGAHNIRLAGLTVEGGQDGIVTAPDTTAVVLSDLVVDNVEADGVRTFSPDARIAGARITGGTTGIDVAAGTTITNTTINASEEGIRSRSPDPVYAAQVTVDALELGINSAEGSPFLLTDSRVHALESLRGQIDQRGINDLSLPPLNLLGAIGVPLIVLAIVLEELHSARQRRLGTGGLRRRRPPLPLGTA